MTNPSVHGSADFKDDPRWPAFHAISIDEDAGIEAWMCTAIARYMIQTGADTIDELLDAARRYQQANHERKRRADPYNQRSNRGLAKIDATDIETVLDAIGAPSDDR